MATKKARKKTVVPDKPLTEAEESKALAVANGTPPKPGKGYKNCPFCAAVIGASATTCKNCHKDLPRKAGAKSKRGKRQAAPVAAARPAPAPSNNGSGGSLKATIENAIKSLSALRDLL